MVWLLFTLFAQVAPDPLPGLGVASGWVGASFLALVLGWLALRYLPAKDQQLKDFQATKDQQLKELQELLLKVIAAKDTQIEGLLTFHDAQLQSARADYKFALTTIAERVDRGFGVWEASQRRT